MAILKCKSCNEIYEIVFEGTSCEDHGCACDNMDELTPKTADWKNEKHVPMVEKIDGGIKVTVGSTLHPMTPEHWITMIDASVGNKLYRAYLTPDDQPIAEFMIGDVDPTTVKAREYCNVHGLWAN
jgi:superoxide reductase